MIMDKENRKINVRKRLRKRLKEIDLRKRGTKTDDILFEETKLKSNR